MRADLSPRGREASLVRMKAQAFDIVVVGGGIVGAGIARDSATRGLKTVLLERADFASGTSGKTSRLVHGGLRYLRNLKVGLVRQAVRERDILLHQAPNLVRPLAFTIPAYKGGGAGPVTLRLGLFVYDLLSRDKVLPRRKWLDPPEVLGREPKVSAQSLRGGSLYHDALTNDARLVLAVIRAAADAGALVANYAEVQDLVRDKGRVVGVRARDRTTREAFDVLAAAVVNATGVWLDGLRSSQPASQTLRPTKGIHIFLPRERVRNQGAVVLSAKRDGRVVFVLPWDGLTLVGTTDTDFRGDLDRVVPEADDVAYLLESVNAAFPAARVGPQDVVSGYAGLRPLIRRMTGSTKESDISREHEIFEDPDGLISVAGGKLTTQRAMAQEVVDRVCERLGRREKCRTKTGSLGPQGDTVAAFRSLGFDPEEATHLASRHEPQALQRFLVDAHARERILPALPYLWAEVDAAVEDEMAITLADVLVRRLGMFYETSDQGISVAPLVAARIATRLGWNAEKVQAELRAYGELVTDHRRFREEHGR